MDKEKDYEFTAYNKNLTHTAKMLRKTLTKQEKHLWYDFLQKYPVKFYKQRPVGSYIADFYCSEAKLVIELDGSQHYTLRGKEKDEMRTEVMQIFGLDVIRFSNTDVDKNFEGVCAVIDMTVKDRIKNFSQKEGELK